MLSIEYTAGKNLELTDYSTRNPLEETSTQETYKEEKVSNNLSETFKVKPQIRPVIKHGPKILSSDESTNMVLATNRELTNEIASPKKFTPDVKSKKLTREGTQAVISISQNYILVDKTNTFDFKDSKMEKKFTCKCHHWGSNNKIKDINIRRDKSP